MKILNNKHDRKFNNQVSHLQSFIGMPMWNGSSPTLSEIREYDRRLLERQALGFKTRSHGIFYRLSAGLRLQISKVVDFFFQTKKKTKSIKHEITALSQPECCG